MEVRIGMNESHRLDVTGVPCCVIAVVGDLWHFEVLGGQVFLVESLVDNPIENIVEILG